MDYETLIETILLGLIEGLTEFIPVSSTGHLILFQHLIGFEGPPGRVFEIVIQLGAILAVCWLYRARLWRTLIGLTHDERSWRFALNVLFAFLPAMLVGAVAHGFIKSTLFNPYVVCASLILGGLAILVIEHYVRRDRVATVDDFRFRLSLKIGVFQCLAMIPGVSRSGATIMGARLLGVSRAAAAEFSFFLAIPTMIAATTYDIYKNHDVIEADNWLIIAVGFAVAFLTAMMVVSWLVAFVSRHGFGIFAWYRICLGLVMLGWLAVGIS